MARAAKETRATAPSANRISTWPRWRPPTRRRTIRMGLLHSYLGPALQPDRPERVDQRHGLERIGNHDTQPIIRNSGAAARGVAVRILGTAHLDCAPGRAGAGRRGDRVAAAIRQAGAEERRLVPGHLD